jgi:hypothetical protein
MEEWKKKKKKTKNLPKKPQKNPGPERPKIIIALSFSFLFLGLARLEWAGTTYAVYFCRAGPALVGQLNVLTSRFLAVKILLDSEHRTNLFRLLVM